MVGADGADYLPCSVGSFTLHAGQPATIIASVLSDRQLGWQGELVSHSIDAVASAQPGTPAFDGLVASHLKWWEGYWAASWVS